MSRQALNLADCTSILRSKNAGPYHLTFDVFFVNREVADRFLDSWRSRPSPLAIALGVASADVVIEEAPSLCAAKITVPRLVDAGAVTDLDVLGCQQVAVLMELEA